MSDRKLGCFITRNKNALPMLGMYRKRLVDPRALDALAETSGYERFGNSCRLICAATVSLLE